MRGIRLAASALGVAGMLALGAARPARALSFTMPDGAVITNLQFSDPGGVSSYNGTTQSINIILNVTEIQYSNAPNQQLTAGSVQLVLAMDLVGSVTDGPSSITGLFDNGASDFSILDVADGGVPLLTGSFDGGTTLALIKQFGFLIFQGNIGGNYTASDPVPNVFFNAMGNTGNLAINLANVNPNSGLANGSGGLVGFTFTSTGAMNPDNPTPVNNGFPTPEPGTGLMLAGGLLSLALARRGSR